MTIRHKTGVAIATLLGLLAVLLPATSIQAAAAPMVAAQASTGQGTKCPPIPRCTVVQPPYIAIDGDVTNYSSYDKWPGKRPISKIVIHDTEGSLADTLQHFQDPLSYVSIHFIVDRDGSIIKMVDENDMAWHAGNWRTNMDSIGIEFIGQASDPQGYPRAQMLAGAMLVRYLSNKYDIPRDRDHIVGHDNVPASRPGDIATQHVDPGPFWNWEKFMTMIGAKQPRRSNVASSAIMVAPSWKHNKQLVTGCADNICVPAGERSTNFLYLRSEPRTDAAMITDPVLGQGTTDVLNNASRVFFGQKFAVADRRVEQAGVWYQVWFNGVKGWIFSPANHPAVAPVKAPIISFNPGTTSAAVYGRAIPERSEYPADLLATPPGSWYIPSPTPLPYTVNTEQRYVATDLHVQARHFYAWASDSSYPYDHTVFTGTTPYIEFNLGNRPAVTKQSYVLVN